MNFSKVLKSSGGYLPLNISGVECGFNNEINQSEVDIISKNEWVWAAIDTVATAFAMGEVHLYKNVKGKREEVFEHPILKIFKNPNPIQDQYEFMKMVGVHFTVFGEAIIHYNSILEELFPIFPSSIVDIKTDTRGFPISYKYNAGSKNVTVPADEIIHIKEVGANSFIRGFNVFNTYRETAVSDNYANEWNRKNFDGTKVDGMLSTKDSISKEKKSEIQDGWMSMFNWRKKKKVAVVDAGMEYIEFGKSPKDMDFLNLTENAKQRILAANRVPKALIGQGEDSNKASIWGIEYIFAKYNTKPKHTSFSSKLNHSFVNRYWEKENLELEISTLIPVDMESKLAIQKADFECGALNQNEIRNERGRDAIDGGDDTYISNNLVKVGAMEVIPEKKK